jgi:TPR repeat protein
MMVSTVGSDYTPPVHRPAIASAILLCLLTGCGNLPSSPNASGTGALSVQELRWNEMQGDPEAAFKLGASYHDGDGVQKDLAEARKWFEVAAKAGERRAQFNLGLMYLNGEGGDKDVTLARRWFERAADQGNERAHFQLGLMYYKGEGQQQDFAKAKEHFQSAALSDVAEAQTNMGVMAVRAEAGSQDLVEAYAWFTIAAEKGSATAIESKAKLESSLSTAQKEQAAARVAAIKKDIGGVVRFGN